MIKKNASRNNFEKYNIADYNLSKDWIFPYSEVEKESDIILYGAGDVGQAYYIQIQLTGYCAVVKWVDKNFDAYEGLGMIIEEPNSIMDCNYDHIIIAVCKSSIAMEIYNELLELGIEREKVVWIGNERKTIRGTLVDNRLIQPIKERLVEVYRRRGIDSENKIVIEHINEIEEGIRNKEALILPRLVIELTTACTLKCKGCNNLMPLYKKTSHVPKENVIRDIRRILGTVDGIITVELIGGEPFVYPWLADILNEVLSYKAVEEVEITTNGTIIPGDEVLELLRTKKVTVKISHYMSVDYKNDISLVLHQNGIRYEKYTELQWIDSGGTDCRNRSRDEIRSIYMSCYPGKHCKTMYNGRIYACARAASLHDLGICDDVNGYIDIHKAHNLREEIRMFWLKESDESCNYCDFNDGWRIIPAGIQI